MASRRFKNKKKPLAEMNVVPYIDVMLVLLVIFMVTSPFIQQGVEVDLPQTEDSKTLQDSAAQVRYAIVEVNAKGQIRLSINHENWQTGINLDSLIKQLQAEKKNHSNLTIGLGGDKNTPFQSIVEILDALKKAGIEKVGLLTEAQS